MPKNLKIALIFSPFVVPSYVPLGIAQLKSYIKKELPSVEVFNLDLNNCFYNNLAEKGLQEKFTDLCVICPKKCKQNKNKKDNFFNLGKTFKISVECLRDKKTGAFYDVSKYNYFISKIISFWGNRERCIDAVVKDVIQKKSFVLSGLENLFEGDIRKVSELKPDFVGFSLFSKNQLPYSLALAKMIKKRLNLPVLFGGAFMNYVDIQEFLAFFSFIDFVIGKEGEIGIVEFIKSFSRRNFENVPGLYYRKNKQISFNRPRFIENLDHLPTPDFSDFKLDQYLSPLPVLPVVFSRGCFWRKCTFCTYYKNYPVSYKSKSVKKFIAEIRNYKALGVKHLFIVDDAISALDLNSISSALRKNKIEIFFGAIVRPEANFSCKVLKNIYFAGGRVLMWGVESSCQRILDLMNKGTRAACVKSILKRSSASGFYNHLFMIRGFPTQSKEEAYQDVKFLQENRKFIHGFAMHDFILERGSYIFDNPGKFKVSSLKAIPIYTRTKDKASIHSYHFTFKGSTKLDWERIANQETKISKRLRNSFLQEYIDFEHSHTLLHEARAKSKI